ncbi:protein phosphatase 2C domain-containing protein [Streptomyces sp. MK7]|uniref:protein phosphatase 2C domain-containing protein n=1 Tax=Streptomyces sp. MK7 TaxID=3067635 RepID=UPI002931B2D1|nr:protein phosphatase 2C domain-containing protein [Streptomyces sp. MK7]
MSQQGGRPTGREDDWWAQLYDDSTEDTGPTAAADSLDDRFASAAGTLGRTPGTARDGGAPSEDRPDTEADMTDGGTDERTEDWSPPDMPEAPEAPEGGPRSPARPATVPAPRTAPPAAPPPDAPAATAAPEQPDAPPDPRRPPADAPGTPGPAPDWWQETPWDRPSPPSADPTPDPPDTGADTETDTDAAGGADTDTDTGTDLDLDLDSGLDSDFADADFHSAPPEPAAAPDLDVPAPLTVAHVGSRPPTYDAEPTALPAADPDELDDLVPDTVLDGARYGACTLRAVSIRGDSPRYRGEPRRDALLTARFGQGEQALVLVAMATGARAAPAAHRAAAEVCRWIARAVGRSHARLAEDIRAARRSELKSGLHRLTDRSLGRLRAGAAEQGIEPEEYAATLRCLLLPADPACRARVFFGVGAGGLFRLRDGEWEDIEPDVPEPPGSPGSPWPPGPLSGPAETPEGDRLTMDLGVTPVPGPHAPAAEPPREPFRFRASIAHPGDTLLMCTAGLADPLRGEAELRAHLARRWSVPSAPVATMSVPPVPGLAAFLADAQVRVKGYADDRTAAAVWEA